MVPSRSSSARPFRVAIVFNHATLTMDRTCAHRQSRPYSFTQIAVTF
jgi:hypothetical protein